MTTVPSSMYQNKSPKNKCWGCGKHLVISVNENGCMRIYDDMINHGSKVYGYACKPYCIAINDGEKI